VLVHLLPHVEHRLTSGWEQTLRNSGRSGAVAASMGANTLEDSSAAYREIIDERLLRELTAETLILLRFTQDAEGGSSPARYIVFLPCSHQNSVSPYLVSSKEVGPATSC